MSNRDGNTTSGANQRFAMGLHQQLAKARGDFFYSPVSISMALALLEAGSGTATQEDLRRGLGFAADCEVGAELADLCGELALRSELTESAKETLRFAEEHPDWYEGELPTTDSLSVRLAIANALWRQTGYACNDSYVNLIRQRFGARIDEVDFSGAPGAACGEINRWVSEQTNDRIENMVSPSSIGPLARLILTSAIYFKGAWQSSFLAEATTLRDFYRSDGSKISVNMMRQALHADYRADDGIQTIKLPYIQPDVAMVIVLPKDLQALEQRLCAEDAAALLFGGYKPTYVDLSLPRFRIEFETSLREILTVMGLGRMFTEAADFRGISSEQGLHVDEVIHKTFVQVDEEGTEAAAVTAAIVAGSAMMPEPVSMTVDRPFLFFIVDQPTETILFAGRAENLKGQVGLPPSSVRTA